MELQYENPLDKYAKVTFRQFTVMISMKDITGQTLEVIIDHCKNRFQSGGEGRAAVIYYLRGTVNFADHAEVLIGFQVVSVLPKQLYEIVHCLQFWNQEGRKMYPINGKANESYPGFVLRCIAADCRVFVKPYPALFNMDTDESSVWIDTKQGNRILTIRF